MKIICLVSKITSIILIMASSRPKTRSATDHRLVGQEDREEKERAKVVKEILEKEAGSVYIDMSSESGGAGVNITNTEKSMESLQEQIAPSTSSKRQRTRFGEAQIVMLEVPKNILELTQQIASAKGISAEAYIDLVAAFISASGGDVSDFILSIVTGYRTREKVAGIVTEQDQKSIDAIF